MELDLKNINVRTAGSVDSIAFCDEQPKYAVVNFTSMNPGKFERWSWFYENRLSLPCLYVFLKDDEQHYYLGRDRTSDTTVPLIKDELARHGIPPHRCVSVGSSMGGFGALYFAHVLEMRAAIAINPQVDRTSAELHKFSLWQRRMDEVAGWQDLDAFVSSHPARPTVFLRTGAYPADVAAGQKLDAVLVRKGLQQYREFDTSAEHGWVGMSANRLRRLIEFLLTE